MNIPASIPPSLTLHHSELIQAISAALILRPILLLFEHCPLLIHSATAILSLSCCLISQPSLPLSLLTIYLCAESAFHLLFLHRYRQLHQTKLNLLPPPIPSAALRQQIVDGLISSFQSSSEFRQSLADWFYHIHTLKAVHLHQIHHDNLAQLLASLIFSTPLDSLPPVHRAEIHADIRRTQLAIKHVFKQGLNPQIRSYQHTLDPIQAQHRPLFFYLIIESLRILLHILLSLVGFRRHSIPLNQTSFSYWFHPGLSNPSSAQHPPIILVAGIVGLISVPHYAIYLLWKTRRPIFLVGNLSVSLTLSKPELDLVRVVPETAINNDGDAPVYRRKIQTLAEQSLSLKAMLDRHGFPPRSNEHKDTEPRQAGGAFLIGHSLGTCLTAHFVRHHPKYVVGTLSIDPISVLPYIPDLVRGFLYTEPKTVGQLLVRVISREIGVATVIQRHFHWFEFVMFPHLDQPGSPLGVSASHRHHFVLSEHDALVNHAQLARYLAMARPNCTFTSLQAAPHAGFLFFYLRPVVHLSLALLASSSPHLSRSHPPSPPLPLPASSSPTDLKLHPKPSHKPKPSFFRTLFSNPFVPLWTSSSDHFNAHLSVYWLLLFFVLLVGLPS
ncbi:hypothetical protein PGT21_004917 [Puccinia graminis f. sp. tritici]|uniref:AB hydrolase-1 domain-containing protein n=1 Tax=Puccinia graminis f. sp. tritici TaxID=56615 RepID=A0A5B0MT98_PUCGR|nr:hypothetical protein PGTUg99_022588 [Puccinia graminis f. sp. tritici]KAA1103934.1 hypothetical protein PGT21_004917 [Puccinia graminis f. sp. tritici]